MKENNCQFRILYQVKVYFRIESGNKDFPDYQKQGGFTISKYYSKYYRGASDRKKIMPNRKTKNSRRKNINGIGKYMYKHKIMLNKK